MFARLVSNSVPQVIHLSQPPKVRWITGVSHHAQPKTLSFLSTVVGDCGLPCLLCCCYSGHRDSADAQVLLSYREHFIFSLY